MEKENRDGSFGCNSVALLKTREQRMLSLLSEILLKDHQKYKREYMRALLISQWHLTRLSMKN